MLHQCQCCATLKSLGNEVMAVHFFARQGNEQRAGDDLPRINASLTDYQGGFGRALPR